VLASAKQGVLVRRSVETGCCCRPGGRHWRPAAAGVLRRVGRWWFMTKACTG